MEKWRKGHKGEKSMPAGNDDGAERLGQKHVLKQYWLRMVQIKTLSQRFRLYKLET